MRTIYAMGLSGMPLPRTFTKGETVEVRLNGERIEIQVERDTLCHDTTDLWRHFPTYKALLIKCYPELANMRTPGECVQCLRVELDALKDAIRYARDRLHAGDAERAFTRLDRLVEAETTEEQLRLAEIGD